MKKFTDFPSIEGSIIIEENIFTDLRGSFERLFDDRKFSNVFFDGVKNINISKNISKGTIRGLHMQKGNFSETKIIFCQKGAIIDLFIDCREDSNTFGEINTVKLDGDENKTLLVPRGCLHSFLTLEENTEVIYLTDNYYSPESEVSVSPFSEEIIDAFSPHKIKVISDKDKNAEDLSHFFKKL
jgi:dTDP-4-dehydrorhamnose 3,5-epimerase